jgi:hypothetical protein
VGRGIPPGADRDPVAAATDFPVMDKGRFNVLIGIAIVVIALEILIVLLLINLHFDLQSQLHELSTFSQKLKGG